MIIMKNDNNINYNDYYYNYYYNNFYYNNYYFNADNVGNDRNNENLNSVI